MNKITEKMLKIITDYGNLEKSSYNIREDGQCVGRRSTKNVSIEPLFDRSGIEIKVNPNTKGETVYIPACLTKSGVNDLVYNDFYIGENSDVTIVAGCAVHTDGENESLHNGIHRFFLGKNSKVIYLEKHIGEGDGDGARKIDPVTEIELDEGASITLDTLQISGVDYSNRKTRAKLAAKAKMLVRERIMTDRDEEALTDFEVELNGEDSGVDIISRSVAKGNSYQGYSSRIIGRTRCTGHSECDAILSDNGRVEKAGCDYQPVERQRLLRYLYQPQAG